MEKLHLNPKYRITVIMAVYNCATTLHEALDSLYAQTYKNFKLILCDDASTDSTYKIAREYIERYDNITLLQNKKNMKLAATLNRCLKYADTEYIARMDGDDISLPTRFEKEISFLDQNPHISIVSSAMIYFDEFGDYRESTPIQYPNKKDFIRGTPFAHAACMVRSSAYFDVGGYDETIVRGQDYDLWFRMYAKGHKGFNINEPLYKMRDDKNAISRRKFKYRIMESLIRSRGFKMLNLPFYYQFYTLRPILIGLLPKKIYTFLRRKQSNCRLLF
ncbi:glycosyltransferase [Proteiniphilum acetatigenes]|uniref:glycosyltransferase n=1 Tax=Proteiniphilum acetatigenes TaxID=294710 RepID=UPI0003A1D832|nr:glycosyltransferase [Proteiniphilum acetatigenes]